MKNIASKVQPNQYHKILAVGVSTILLLMPLHGILSVGLGKITGQMTVVQAWKEVVILILMIVAAVGLINRRIKWSLDYVNKSALIVLLLSLVLVALHPVDAKSLAFGIKTDLLPIILFFIAQVASPAFTKENLFHLVVWPATLVAVMAIAQIYIVPISLLTAIGYNLSTINPLQLVDPALNLVRAFSTLGGPNQLGAYLIVTISILTIYIIKKHLWWYILPLGLMLFALVLSFSRSAWIGLLTCILVIPFLLLQNKARIAYTGLAILAVVMIATSVNQMLKDPANSTAQYILLHGRVFENRVEGSDAGRLTSAQSGISVILSSPLGKGLGMAGPASFYSKSPIISENWYLQIGIEMGIIGLLAYLAFFLTNGVWLYRSGRRGNLMSIGVLAGLIGLSIVNLFLHTWADSTLALVFFAILGLNKGLTK